MKTKTLYLSNQNFALHGKDLLKIFSDLGFNVRARNLRMPCIRNGPRAGVPTGTALIQFKNVTQAAAAIRAIKYKEIAGRTTFAEMSFFDIYPEQKGATRD